MAPGSLGTACCFLPDDERVLTRTSADNPGSPRVDEHSLQRESTGGLLESFQACVNQHQDERAAV